MFSTGALAAAAIEPQRRLATLIVGEHEKELLRCTEILRTTAATRRRTLVSVVGDRGMGKTTLLRRVATEAKSLGFRVARIGLTEQCRPEALARLLSGPGATAADLPEVLADRSNRTPTLITVDDLRWNESVAALESLFSHATSRPLVCVLARRPNLFADDLDPLFRYLEERDSIVHLPLRRLNDDAVKRLCMSVLGAEPDNAVVELLACAEGIPGEVIRLLEEFAHTGVVHCSDLVVTLSPEYAGTPENPRLPESVQAMVLARLDQLPPDVQLAVDVAAVLGRTFAPGDVAQMLGRPTAALTTVFREALRTDVLECVVDGLRFRSALTWQIVLRNIPHSIRGALHDQAADLLFSLENRPEVRAEHLMGATLRGKHMMKVLCTTARQVLESSPSTAAGLTLRGLEATWEGEERLELTVIAAEACARSGPLSRAVALAEDTLRDDVGPETAMVLQHWLAMALTLQGKTDEAKQVADGLAEGAADHAGHAARLLETRAVADVLLGIPATGHHEDGEPFHAALAWQSGFLGRALRMSEEALSSSPASHPVTWIGHPRLVRLLLLTSARDFTGARAALAELVPDVDPLLRGMLELLSAKIALGTGHPESAANKAVECLAIAKETGAHLYLPMALTVLTAAAARRVDLTAKMTEDSLVAWASAHVPQGRNPALEWARAQLAIAGDHGYDCTSILDLLSNDVEALVAVLTEETIAAAWIVRTALAIDMPDRAIAAADVAQRLAEGNPDIRHLALSAAHARALLDGEHDVFAMVAEEHPDAEVRASATEDLGIALVDSEREAAVSWLQQAVTLYESIDAHAGAARTRRRLRELGVVKRLGRTSAGRATDLTKAERAVASLVGAGLTNKQIGSRLFLSHHTVAFHLRNTFRKLGIRSRVELAHINHSDGLPSRIRE